MRAPSLLAQCLPGLVPQDRGSVSTISDRDMHLPSPAVEILPSKVYFLSLSWEITFTWCFNYSNNSCRASLNAYSANDTLVCSPMFSDILKYCLTHCYLEMFARKWTGNCIMFLRWIICFRSNICENIHLLLIKYQKPSFDSCLRHCPFSTVQAVHPYKYMGENVDLQGLNVFRVYKFLRHAFGINRSAYLYFFHGEILWKLNTRQYGEVFHLVHLSYYYIPYSEISLG